MVYELQKVLYNEFSNGRFVSFHSIFDNFCKYI